MIRTFIALDLDDSIRSILGGVIGQMAQELPPIRWVDPQGIHLTLSFLGDLTDEQVAKARQAAEAAAQQVGSFKFRLSHLGVFDSSQYPRVIWVGVNEPSGALQQLHRLLSGELELRGFAVEKRVFSPHLTLARIKVPLGPDEGERQLMKRFGLTLTQYWALVHLNTEEGRSLSELADLLICDKSNVTSIVDKLEESGLAERKRGKAGDRRYIRVVLTPQGQQLRNTLIATQEHLLRMRFQTLNVENLLKLLEPLQQLASTLQAQFKNNEVPTMIENSIEHMRAEQGAPAILSHISQNA